MNKYRHHDRIRIPYSVLRDKRRRIRDTNDSQKARTTMTIKRHAQHSIHTWTQIESWGKADCTLRETSTLESMICKKLFESKRIASSNSLNLTCVPSTILTPETASLCAWIEKSRIEDTQETLAEIHDKHFSLTTNTQENGQTFLLKKSLCALHNTNAIVLCQYRNGIIMEKRKVKHTRETLAEIHDKLLLHSHISPCLCSDNKTLKRMLKAFSSLKSLMLTCVPSTILTPETASLCACMEKTGEADCFMRE